MRYTILEAGAHRKLQKTGGMLMNGIARAHAPGLENFRRLECLRLECLRLECPRLEYSFGIFVWSLNDAPDASALHPELLPHDEVRSATCPSFRPIGYPQR